MLKVIGFRFFQYYSAAVGSGKFYPEVAVHQRIAQAEHVAVKNPLLFYILDPEQYAGTAELAFHIFSLSGTLKHRSLQKLQLREG